MLQGGSFYSNIHAKIKRGNLEFYYNDVNDVKTDVKRELPVNTFLPKGKTGTLSQFNENKSVWKRCKQDTCSCHMFVY